MDIAGMQCFRLFMGVFLLVASGFLWSLLLFDKRRLAERIVFGFGFSSAAMVILVMALSLVVPATSALFVALFAIFALVPIGVLAVRRWPFWRPDVSWPDRRMLIRLGILAGILAVVFYMTLLPHIVRDYSLPFHADSWVHWAHTRAFLETGKSVFPNPFTGAGSAGLAERGFHVWLGCFSWLSGARLQTIFVLLPSVIAVFTALAAYALGRRSSFVFGAGAALFTAFIPTTIRFLGPSFLVPLSLGLFLTLLALLLAQWEGWRPFPLLAFILLFLTVVHPPSAALAAIALLSYAVCLIADKRYRRGAALAAIVGVPIAMVALLMPLYFHMGVGALLGETFATQLAMVDLGNYLGHMGAVILALFFIGIFAAFYQGTALQRAMTLAAMGYFTIIFCYDFFTIGVPILYDRSFVFFFLFVALVAGYGLACLYEAARQAVAWLGDRYLAMNLKKLVTMGAALAIPVLLCLGNMVAAYPEHEEEAKKYYEMVTESRFNDFVWLRDTIGSYRDAYHSFSRAAVDPHYAAVFSAVTGIHTLSSSFHPVYGRGLQDEIMVFLADQAEATAFLEQHHIGVVYGSCRNEYCTEVHDNVFLYYGVPPVANFTYTPRHPRAGDAVTFTDTSTTRYGRLIDHRWACGDGEISDGVPAGLRCGIDAYARAVNISLTAMFTIDMWVRPSFSFDDGIRHDWLQWRGEDWVVRCFKHTNNRTYFMVTEDNWRAAHTIIPFSGGAWHHFVVTYDGRIGRFTMYWDGEVVAEARRGDRIDGGLGTVLLGGYHHRQFNGSIRDVKIYDEVLSGRDVAANYQGNTITHGLKHWWPFDDGGETAGDDVGNTAAILHGAGWLNEASHIYDSPGTYTVTLQVRNQDGLADSVATTVQVNPR